MNNVKVFVLDTQVYSNTGGQASTASFTGQNTKMSVHGKVIAGKQERRKEIAQIAMMHPRTLVAQTTCAHVNHFYKSVLGALEFDGPAVISCYTTCQPEHGVADDLALTQAQRVRDSRGATASRTSHFVVAMLPTAADVIGTPTGGSGSRWSVGQTFGHRRNAASMERDGRVFRYARPDAVSAVNALLPLVDDLSDDEASPIDDRLDAVQRSSLDEEDD